jgi:hypothetical protein
MRHVLLPGAIAARPHSVGQTTATARLVAPAGSALRYAAGFLRTAPCAVDLTAITAATDQNLSATAATEKEPGRRCLDRFGPLKAAWTKATFAGIMPRHSCLHDAGHGAESKLASLGRRRACPSKIGRFLPRLFVVSECFQRSADYLLDRVSTTKPARSVARSARSELRRTRDLAICWAYSQDNYGLFAEGSPRATRSCRRARRRQGQAFGGR